MRSCEIYLDGIKAGVLDEKPDGSFIFVYDNEYLDREDAKAVSLTLPLTKEPYHSPRLFPAFANILSEGENRRIQSQLFHVDPEDDFGIMLQSCRFDTIGAITVKPLEV